MNKFNNFLKEFKISKSILFILFGLMVAIQLGVPFYTLSSKKIVVNTGTAFKFRIKPIDPSDPFRGKYITLDFIDNRFIIDSTYNKNYNGTAIVQLTTDSLGFAVISDVNVIGDIKISESAKEIAKTEETQYNFGNPDYIKTSVWKNSVSNEIYVNYPFNRFYMEESKAYPAEKLYGEMSQDSSNVAYALVYVKNGDAVVANVFINDTPIVDLINATK